MVGRPVIPLSSRASSPWARWTFSVLLATLPVCLVFCTLLRADEKPKPAAAEDPAAVRFRELRNLYRRDPAKAAAGFRGFLKSFPKSDWADDAQYWLAMSLEKSRAKRRDVVAAYQALVDKHPKSSYRDDACFAVAEVWRRRARRPEDRTQAIKAYLDFIEKCPKSKRLSEAKLKIGELYRGLRKYKKAAGFFRRVVKEHPKSSFATHAHLQLARTYLKLGRVEEALAIYSGRLKTNLPEKQRIGVRLDMVDCYLRQKDRENGLKKALKTCKDIREEARRKKGLEDYAEYKTREKMARFYLGRKKYTEAEAEYQAYIARFGKSVGVWQARLNIGTIRLAAGKPADARKILHVITSKYPPGPKSLPWYVYQAMYFEAYTYEIEKNRCEARRHYKSLLEHYPRTYYGRRARKNLEKLEKEAKKEAEKEAKKEAEKEAKKKPAPPGKK